MFFDDLEVVHRESAVVQADDYYPFGMTFNSYKRAKGSENRFLYNGNERIDDLDIGLDDFNVRSYDPTIGRFTNVDPLADEPEQMDQSPYQYSWNNPVTFNDPTGECPACWTRLAQLAQRARPALQRGAQWVRRNGSRTGRAIQTGWNSLRRASYYSKTSPWQREVQNWIGRNIQGLQGYYYQNAQLVGEAGAFLAGAIDPNPAADYSMGGGDELGNAVGAALRKSSGAVLDFFGGAKSSLKNGVSIDPQAVSGFRGTISEFAEQFFGSKVGEIVANNPQASFMKEASQLLEEGGTLTIRGQMANKFFKQVWKNVNDGFEVISKKTGLSTSGFTKTDGSPLGGASDSLNEIVLKKL